MQLSALLPEFRCLLALGLHCANPVALSILVEANEARVAFRLDTSAVERPVGELSLILHTILLEDSDSVVCVVLPLADVYQLGVLTIERSQTMALGPLHLPVVVRVIHVVDAEDGLRFDLGGILLAELSLHRRREAQLPCGTLLLGCCGAL